MHVTVTVDAQLWSPIVLAGSNDPDARVTLPVSILVNERQSASATAMALLCLQLPS